MRPAFLVWLLSFLFFLAPASVAADATNDEAYARRLEAAVDKLRNAVRLLGEHQRALDMLEAGVTDVQLGLADPTRAPEKVVRRLLQEHHPRISIVMEPSEKPAHGGVSIWSWRTRLNGPLRATQSAIRLLNKNGLFFTPTPEDPLVLRFVPEEPGQVVWTFVGRHVRLEDAPSPVEEKPQAQHDLFRHRTDPRALRIKALQKESLQLRQKLAEFERFKKRLDAISQYLKKLTVFSSSARNPLADLAPLLKMELVRLEQVEHRGKSILLRGRTFSAEALRLARAWFSRHRPQGITVDAQGITVDADNRPNRVQGRHKVGRQAGQTDQGAPRKKKHGPRSIGHARFAAWAAQARAVDLMAAAGGPTLLFLPGKDGPRTPKQTVVGAAAQGATLLDALKTLGEELAMSLVPGGAGTLLGLPPGLASQAKKSLPPHPRRTRRGRAVSLSCHDAPLHHVVSSLFRLRAQNVLAPQRFWDQPLRVTAQGRASIQQWLHLLGAPWSLLPEFSRKKIRLVAGDPEGNGPSLVPAPATPALEPRCTIGRRSPARRAPLAQLRFRLLLRTPRGFKAVVSRENGAPWLVTAGQRLGLRRSRVEKVDQRGIWLRWSGQGKPTRLLLPF